MLECYNEISKSIKMNCTSPIHGGYTGRALLYKYEDNPTLTLDGANPRILSAIAFPTGSTAKPIAIVNLTSVPFDGSTTTGNADSGRVMFNKAFNFRIPLRGAGNSKDIVEPLANSAEGYFLIAEKKDKVGDGSFEVIGMQVPLRVTDPSTITRNESENGGDIAMTMATSEYYFECSYFTTDYATTKAAFDALFATAAA